FFRAKSANIVAAARDIVERFNGDVPKDRESLESLAGVGRKTASVVLANAFDEPALAVDTHVFRVAHRLGLTAGKTPLDVERDLVKIVPKEKWGLATHWLILHGRAVCTARSPRCTVCPLLPHCPTGAKIVKKPARS
ncbi:MAG: endonuclease III domain-containing protein, partial [Candidatus Tyrphobacter sp.]